MKDIRQSFEEIRFTQEEQAELAQRLCRAAEQEEMMTEGTKRKVKKVSRGVVIGIAAALTLTAGALAATLSTGLRGYFDTATPGAQEKLESSIYQLGRSLEYNGWTVALTDCVGDDNKAFIWVEVTAPEDVSLTESENRWFRTLFDLSGEGIAGPTGGSLYTIPDGDPEDNKLSFCIEASPWVDGGLRGAVMDITLDPIEDVALAEGENYQEIEMYERTEAIRDHSWLFEDVVLDYPDQAIRLEPGLEVDYLDGTATLSQVTISPLTVTVRVEGGSCYDYDSRIAKMLETEAEAENPSPDEKVIETPSGTTITFGSGDGAANRLENAQARSDLLWGSLGVEVHMKDGTVLSQLPKASGCSGDDGLSTSTPEKAYVEGMFHYKEMNHNLIPDRIIDPSQVDYVTVCGVDIPVNGK